MVGTSFTTEEIYKIEGKMYKVKREKERDIWNDK
jgi:hypothetical protein